MRAIGCFGVLRATACLAMLALPLVAQKPAADCGCTVPPPAPDTAVNPAVYAAMRWRQVGPFRGGRVSAVAGVAGHPAVYYFGSPGGGVWKTTDGGWVWKPIFDATRVASIGALAVAPSNPSIIYVGTGNVSDVGHAGNDGDGMWKSSDGGRSWTHIGLAGTRHIPSLFVDPRNPNLVVVAALGPRYARSHDRGIFHSRNGGRTWRQVLFISDTVGAVDLAAAPDDPKVMYAAVWRHYVAPLQGGSFNGLHGGAIYRSQDEGKTWQAVAETGLPAGQMGRIGLAVAPGHGGERVYGIVAARHGGVFRSDNGGRSWRRMTRDPRVVGSGYFSRVWVDPGDANEILVAQTCLYRSMDGGKTFAAFKGAPGGDDYHQLWINPLRPADMILGSDQGASISMDGGRTWSSWYNQPTGQMYHLSTDDQFPFWIYATQQDSGSVGTASRGAYGEITPFDWDAVAGDEFGYIVPDPLHPWLIYAGGPGRGVVRINRRDKVVEDVSPDLVRHGALRFAQNPPLVFSPVNPRELLFGAQYVMATEDGGRSWRKLSPDLTLRSGPKPGGYYPPAISTIAPSPRDGGVIWAGSNNGVVEVTGDAGGSWTKVTPPGLPDGAMIEMIEASHFQAGEAFVAVDEHTLGDSAPHIYRTQDFGKSWTQISAGIPRGDFVRVVREDPQRPGLLYAGTENGVFVSFDDGGRWQSLQLNLPTASVRDLAIRHNDLVAATYGRAFWILDDLTPLRQARQAMTEPVYLFRPEEATRTARDRNQDTPLPPEVPHGANPPAGAILDYYLARPASGAVTLAIYDTAGHLVRRYASTPLPPRIADPVPFPVAPAYWLARPRPLPAGAGMHRVVWDLRYTTPPAVRYAYPINAVPGQTPADPRGPFVAPGHYTVRLTADGRSYSQPLTVRLDPRIHVSEAALQAQLQLEQKLMRAMAASYAGHAAVAALRKRLRRRETALRHSLGQPGRKALALRVAQLERQAAQLEGGNGRVSGPPRAPSFAGLNAELAALATTLEEAPAAPTPAAVQAAAFYARQLRQVTTRWDALRRNGQQVVNSGFAPSRAVHSGS